MLTICWAAKGGSGTSVVAAALALASPSPALLVDLAGDAPLTLGLDQPDTPGVFDWLASDATTDRLAALEIPLSDRAALLHRGAVCSPTMTRWERAANLWVTGSRHVIVDAGTTPPARLLGGGHHTALVTRPCYLAIRAAQAYGVQPSRIILVREPGRSLKPGDIESSIGAPVTSIIEWDPAIARAVDSGLLTGRLPGGLRRELQHAA